MRSLPYVITRTARCATVSPAFSPQWFPEIRHHAADVPFILVGTKDDLRMNEDWIARLRAEGKSPKTVEDGEKLAAEIGAVKYCECSALTQVGLKSVFDEAIKVALANKMVRTRKPKKKKCMML